MTKLPKVDRFPLCVHSCDQSGNTIGHHAVNTENDELLDILLQAKLPRFWMPTNNEGHDILYRAIASKARCRVLPSAPLTLAGSVQN